MLEKLELMTLKMQEQIVPMRSLQGLKHLREVGFLASAVVELHAQDDLIVNQARILV